MGLINFIIWIIMGAIIGWLASIVMKTNAQQGLLLDIIVGIVGAFLGGIIFGLIPGLSNVNINDGISIWSIVVSFIGAIVLLGIVNLVRRGSAR